MSARSCSALHSHEMVQGWSWNRAAVGEREDWGEDVGSHVEGLTAAQESPGVSLD